MRSARIELAIPQLRIECNPILPRARECGTPENRTLFHSLKGYCMTGMLVSQNGERATRERR